MRKNYIYAIFLFLLAFTSFGQKVTLTPTTVNGQSVSGGPINLGGTPNSTVGLGITVEMPAIPGNYGTITIHSVNGLNDNIVPGGNGGTLFFGEGKSASRSFVVNLLWSSFTTSGSYIYAEYKTGGGVIYKSSNLAIIKNATQGGGTPQIPADAPDPAKIPNTICCNQTIRLGEKPALIAGSQYLNPYQGQTYGINASWQVNGNPNVGILEADSANKTLSLDYVQNHGNFTVVRGLGYPTTLTPSNKSNTVTITVVPSPITYNEIRVNGSINTDGSIEISSTNPKDILGDRSYINLNVFQDPYYIPKRGDTNIFIDKYEWEYSIINGTTEEQSWNIIPNQFSSSLNSLLLPRSNSSKDNFYSVRRIAIYQNLKVASNSLKILVRGLRDNNTICCNQTLEVSSSNIVETPATITGPITMSNKNTYLFYQWQSQTVTERGAKFSNWTNIPQATSKDYNPPTPQFIPGSGRNQPTVPTYNYRRIATDNVYNGETYYSNETSLTPSTNLYSAQTLKIYPNPATSIINIENTNNRTGGIDFDTANINIVNIMGNIVNSNDFTRVSQDIISINVSNFINGIYFLNVSNNTSGRTYSEQFTFIKK
ncbi:hypothetical protein Flavo103_13320 [Flavobacterium collinsii]|uniref:T9SS type A sorting domain-containing protein n=1 Tax=Flavobacterium collinsii TaxID=1114861 RepID=UPI0022CAD82C|nr:T9SS type A sorting domain-containing protein [Flavobacterium collinsii]GIQ58196.1 hypothetical protein Flavo103_13320 [Flavobacterium collinsii]